jgi:hypothetical protein
VSHGVDAAVQQVQPPSFDLAPDSAVAVPETDQLRMRHNSMLRSSERREPGPISPRLHFIPHTGINRNLGEGSPPALGAAP